MDALHLALLGLPKTPWKFGLKNNSSDDARAQMSDQLRAWKHPLDMKRKADGRVKEQAWFTGESWISFCAGKAGSPGGPIAIATLVMIVADDLQLRGVDAGGEELPPPKPSVSGQRGRGAAALVGARGGARGGRGRGGGRAASFAANMVSDIRQAAATLVTEADPAALQTQRLQLKHVPTAMEAAANPEALAIIRKLYGSRAQTLINCLLSFDAYFNWYYPFKKSIPYGSSTEVKEARAFDNCCKAIDMQEMFERMSIAKHGSFLPHGAVFKVTRDILEVGDVWAHDLSTLEL